MPPTEFPEVARATAMPRLFEKYVAHIPIDGQKKIPLPIPVANPCDNRSCQKVEDTLVVNMPTI